jgi:hypothetical protein
MSELSHPSPTLGLRASLACCQHVVLVVSHSVMTKIWGVPHRVKEQKYELQSEKNPYTVRRRAYHVTLWSW